MQTTTKTKQTRQTTPYFDHKSNQRIGKTIQFRQLDQAK